MPKAPPPPERPSLALAEPSREWAAQRVANAEWPNEGACVADLIARDREHAEKLDYLRQAIADGMASGISSRTVDQIFEDAMARQKGA